MHVYFRGKLDQRLRLASGLVLFAFAATHFLNHALGLVGLEAMHQAQALRTAVTRSLPGTVILLLALVTHVTLAFVRLARRTTWQIPWWEALQIGFGLAIPFLLLPHIVNTRLAHTFLGVEDSYLYELTRLWPGSAIQQSLLLVLVWAHGCIGLHYWLRLSGPYRRIAPALLVGAVALPLAALVGFSVSGMNTAEIMSDPEALAQLEARSNWPDAAESALLQQWRTAARNVFAVLLAALGALVLFQLARRQRRPPGVPVTYEHGRTVFVPPGRTVLEASREAGIPHASVCGGRGRCSTCRIRIEKGLEGLSPPGEAEAITLRSIEAPPDVRLACQLRPSSPVTIALISAPGTRSPLEREFAEVREVVGYHVRAKLAGQLIEFASNDSTNVRAWLEERVGYPLPEMHFDDQSITLEGGRQDFLGKHTIAVVVFGTGSAWISVFVVPNGSINFESVRAMCDGYHVFGWTDDQYHLLAVADPAIADIAPVAVMKDQDALCELERTIQRWRSIGNSRLGANRLKIPPGATILIPETAMTNEKEEVTR